MNKPNSWYLKQGLLNIFVWNYQYFVSITIILFMNDEKVARSTNDNKE